MIRITQYKRRSNLHYTKTGVTDLPQLFSNCDTSEHLKTQQALKIIPSKTHRKKVNIKRLSPFLLLAISLPFVIVWFLISSNHTATDKLFIVSLFVFTEVNLLFADFALWNYFEGKRRLIIWGIELCCVLAVAEYFI